jgi:hypothetical protein
MSALRDEDGQGQFPGSTIGVTVMVALKIVTIDIIVVVQYIRGKNKAEQMVWKRKKTV